MLEVVEGGGWKGGYEELEEVVRRLDEVVFYLKWTQKKVFI